jgi:TonB-dependent starch-binding outer membrane protein SusC
MYKTTHPFLHKFFVTGYVLLFLSLGLQAQDLIVRGTVTDQENGEPLLGATILVTETGNGTVTDFEGKFSLTLSPGNYSLQISYTGYATKEIRNVNSSGDMNIILVEGALLDEVVVVGYTSQKRKDLTGAVSVVKMEEVGQVHYANALQAMQGRVAGVHLTQDGQPGSSRTQVRVRGVTSFNKSDPLLVIDGIPTEEPLDNINPNDIESIQILKDASASIYGSRSAAGVIIITTKKGRNGKLALEGGSSFGYQTIANKINVLNATEWGEVYWQAAKNSNPNGIPSFTGYFDAGGNPQIPVDPQFYDLSIKDQTYQYTPEGTDWAKELYHNALYQQHHLNISNGSDKGSVMFGTSYLNQNGIIKTSFYERFTARLNSSYKLASWLEVNENLSVSWSERLGVPNQDVNGVPFDAIRQHPALPVYDVNGNFAGRVGSFPDVRNTVSTLQRGKDNTSDSWRIFGNAGLSFDVIDVLNILNERHSLKLKPNFGIDYSNFFVQQFNSSIFEGVYQIEDNSYFTAYGDGRSLTLNQIAEYTFSNKRHELKAVAGIESVKYDFRDISAARSDYVVEVGSFITINSGGNITGNGGTRNNWGLFSEFGRIDYAFNNCYLLSAMLRHDKTSRFLTDASFPTVTAGWRISEESFMNNLASSDGKINDIKIRGSWGKLGNQNTTDNPYAAYSTFGPQDLNSNYDIFATNTSVQQGFSVINLGNPFLKWETTTQTNLGLDLILLKNKLSLSFDVYEKITKDLLDNPPSILAVGEGTAPYVNLARVSNKGMEMSLGYTYGKPNADFSATASLQFSTYVNEVLELKDIYPVGYEGERYANKEIRVAEGHALGEFYGWVNEGIFQNQAEVDQHATQTGKGVGRLKFKDVNMDSIINDEDRIYIGNPHPDFTLGLNLGFQYRRFNLDMFWYSSIGQEVYNTTRVVTDFAQNGTYNRGKEILNAWTPENPSATIPMLTLDDGGNDEIRGSSYFVEDGSFLKLRTLRLGYQFPESMPGNFGLSLFVEVQNALTITKYSGVDPEVPQTFRNAIGIDAGVYPLPRTYIFGLAFKL